MTHSDVVVDILASGSSGNCAVLRFGNTALVVDCGVSPRAMKAAFAARGIDAATIVGLLLTHEHRDHIGFLREVRRTWPHWPVWASSGTARGVLVRGGEPMAFENARAGRPISIGEVVIDPIRLSHDAYEPIGYRFEFRDFRIALLTDTGIVTPEVRQAACDVDLLLIESNYDPDLLQNGPYPRSLRTRVAGTLGHLANQQCAEVVAAAACTRLRHVVLMHLSEANNSPAHAVAAVQPHVAPGVTLTCAAQKIGHPTLRFQAGPAVDRRGQGLLLFA